MLAGLLSGCAAGEPDVPRWRVVILGTQPHDTAAFTEGLDIDGDTLYESTGIVGRSWVRATDLTGHVVRAQATLPAPLFGEAVAVADGRMWQLTWRDHVAIERDPGTLAERRQVTLDGEGWGLCDRRGVLVSSDGTNALLFREPNDFAPIGRVRLDRWPNLRLNSLACAADGAVYANDYPTDRILRIDPDLGTVTAAIDASALRPVPLDQRVGNVLNGIAQVPGTDRFLLTGKYWPVTFIVNFTPA
ncbi:MAG: glutaminyl-peptide cyclotransferase [Mycobacteriaceae bacterium]|nr:glutaminyl-peptide cyclotransferase [Mycobacteriaceae bacterium]